MYANGNQISRPGMAKIFLKERRNHDKKIIGTTQHCIVSLNTILAWLRPECMHNNKFYRMSGFTFHYRICFILCYSECVSEFVPGYREKDMSSYVPRYRPYLPLSLQGNRAPQYARSPQLCIRPLYDLQRII